MDSTARFLLGGAIGAALGFLISQKNLEKALKSMGPAGTLSAPGAPSGGAPVAAEDAAAAVAAAVMAPPAPAMAPARPAISYPARRAPEPTTPLPATPAPAPMAPPVAPTSAAAPITAAPPVAPPVAPPAEAPVEVAPEPPVATAPAWRISPARPVEPEPTPPPPDPEVIVTREFLEEPVPGSGWASKATPAVLEDGLEDIVPLASDGILPYAGPEIESPQSQVRADRPDLAWSEPVIESAIEDLTIEAEPEIEAVTEPAVELLVEPIVESAEPTLEAAAEPELEATAEELIVELAERDGIDLGAEVVEAGELIAEIKGPGTVEIEVMVETAQFATPSVEEPIDEQLIAEGRMSPPEEPESTAPFGHGEEGSSEIEALVETASVESGTTGALEVEELVELQEEEVLEEELAVEEVALEEMPVAEAQVAEVEAEVAAVAETATVAEAGPLAETPVAETVPAASKVDDLKARIEETRRRIRHELEQPFETTEETQEAEPDWTVLPVVPETSSSPEATSDLPVPAVVALETEEQEVAPVFPEEPQEPIDYDSMKSRIELTRSRLKAKAFDAMMTGESALLGRDAEDADHKRKKLPSVDSEVDETIESSLREEED